jgi:ectoine hydroxylase-related dioxygenase (phytanoyl-CoA dioxygenase family)
MLTILKNLLSIFSLIFFFFIYLCFGKNTKLGHQSLIRTYILSNGFSNIFYSKIISLFYKKKKFDDQKKLFFNLNFIEKDLEVKKILKNINQNGYFVFEKKLPKNYINELVNFSKEINGWSNIKGGGIIEKKFDEKNFSNNVFNYDENNLIKNLLVKKISINNDFLSIAENYFSSFPILSAINMWWSVPSTKIDSVAGQLYHFDMDRIKFLKFFIYLTDVNSSSGPHCYVEGSHKPNSKKHFLKRGYVRIPDNEIIRSYPEEKIKEINGEAGTIIVGDTSCFHKGLPPINSKRLILEFEYSNSLFGSKTTKISAINKNALRDDLIYKSLIQKDSKILTRYK